MGIPLGKRSPLRTSITGENHIAIPSGLLSRIPKLHKHHAGEDEGAAEKGAGGDGLVKELGVNQCAMG